MNKAFCDKCNAPVSGPGETLEVWDQRFRHDLNGVIWSVNVRGNYMNSSVDICNDCKKEGLTLLIKKARISLEDLKHPA